MSCAIRWHVSKDLFSWSSGSCSLLNFKFYMITISFSCGWTIINQSYLGSNDSLYQVIHTRIKSNHWSCIYIIRWFTLQNIWSSPGTWYCLLTVCDLYPVCHTCAILMLSRWPGCPWTVVPWVSTCPLCPRLPYIPILETISNHKVGSIWSIYKP